MGKYLDRAKELRSDTSVHYNCNQATLMPFARDGGLTEEQAKDLGTYFGSGMRMGSVCGAITGGLMALGLLAGDDKELLNKYYKTLRERHDGRLNCADLLRKMKEEGIPQKQHCDGMVFECVELVEELLMEQQAGK